MSRCMLCVCIYAPRVRKSPSYFSSLVLRSDPGRGESQTASAVRSLVGLATCSQEECPNPCNTSSIFPFLTVDLSWDVALICFKSVNVLSIAGWTCRRRQCCLPLLSVGLRRREGGRTREANRRPAAAFERSSVYVGNSRVVRVCLSEDSGSTADSNT